MSNGDSKPVDAFLDERAQEFTASLDLTEQWRVGMAVDYLMANPYPDGETKIRLPRPFRFGAIGCRADGFFILYEFENASTIRILTIGWDTPYYFG